jgi:LuxR family maltose regulon positive regulatory protein
LGYLEQSSQDDGSFQGELAAYRMSLAYRRGDYAHIFEFGERALALLPPDNLAVRARVSYLLGFVHLIRAHLKKSQSLMADACEMGMKAGDLWVRSNGAGYLGTILWRRGRLRQALDMARRAVDLAGQSPAAALPLWVLASVLYELNDLEGAARSAQLAIELSEPGRTAEPSIVNYFLLAQKQLAQGAEADAVLQMQKADQVALHPSVPPYMRAGHTANRVMFAIQQEDLASAIDWGKRLSEYPDDVLPVWYQLVRPRLLIAQGEKTAAAAQLRGLYERAVQAGAQGFVIVIRVSQALAAVDPAQGLTYLAEALTLGQPEGYIRTFVDEGRLLAPLLRKAIAQGISPE